jgi:hypothetical protein
VAPAVRTLTAGWASHTLGQPGTPHSERASCAIRSGNSSGQKSFAPSTRRTPRDLGNVRLSHSGESALKIVSPVPQRIRTGNPSAHQWSQSFVNSKVGTLSASSNVGEFKDGRIVLIGQDNTVNEKTILVRAAAGGCCPPAVARAYLTRHSPNTCAE